MALRFKPEVLDFLAHELGETPAVRLGVEHRCGCGNLHLWLEPVALPIDADIHAGGVGAVAVYVTPEDRHHFEDAVLGVDEHDGRRGLIVVMPGG